MEFDWDEGNRGKNLRHDVQDWEIEEAFSDRRRISQGVQVVDGERRYVLLARAATSGKYLRIIYTIRERDGVMLVRPISAYLMPANSRRRYDEGRR
jgi:uncharacterized DUF497 family protein